jgi:nucleoid-associated protein YgaU
MYMNNELFYRPSTNAISQRATAGTGRNLAKLSKLLVLFAAVLLVLAVSLWAPVLGGERDALAATNSNAKMTVEIEQGDTLWAIAVEHADKGQDVRKYINDLKLLNGLKSSVLHEGQILQLP